MNTKCLNQKEEHVGGKPFDYFSMVLLTKFIDYRLQTPVNKVGFLLRASYIQQCS